MVLLISWSSQVLLNVCFFRLQEISTGAVETARSLVGYDNWAKSMMKVFANKGYYLVCQFLVLSFIIINFTNDVMSCHMFSR